MITDHETTPPKPTVVHGTSAWWELWSTYKTDGLGRAAYLIDRMQSDEIVLSKSLEREEGYDQCLAILDEVEAAIKNARAARQAMHDLGKPKQGQIG